MKIDILTLFPEMFEAVLGTSIIGRARDKGILDIEVINIRDFSTNKHRQADDYPYGGGPGMVMSPQPLFHALYHVLEGSPSAKVIYFSPQGETLKQDMAERYGKLPHLVLICGHYEGIDQRVIDEFVDEEISIGDYVLTGGELPSMVFIDCISRLIPGVLGSSLSTEEESFTQGLLEYPHYTRPQTYEGHEVPEVLLSGNHKYIEDWKQKESLRNTLNKRPDLLEDKDLSIEEIRIIKKLKGNEE
ncbi:MAG TPA: tRNA (guanosine(37)-N1)-methyltransferase TrmD [Clostridia bacterium]|nr:tRNA (guanosine(37)-N1)-methyltransferase TrmD [Clostridia bacterium]